MVHPMLQGFFYAFTIRDCLLLLSARHEFIMRIIYYICTSDKKFYEI